MYEVSKIFGFFDLLPPCHCHKSGDFVPFCLFFGDPLPLLVRTSYMEAPLQRLSDSVSTARPGLKRRTKTESPTDR